TLGEIELRDATVVTGEACRCLTAADDLSRVPPPRRLVGDVSRPVGREVDPACLEGCRGRDLERAAMAVPVGILKESGGCKTPPVAQQDGGRWRPGRHLLGCQAQSVLVLAVPVDDE